MSRVQTVLAVLALLTLSVSAYAQDEVPAEAPVEQPAVAPEATPEPTPAPAPVAAAETPQYDTHATGASPLHEGATSLSLGIPGGGNPYAAGTAGIFYAFSPAVNVGFNIGLAMDSGGPDTVFNLLLAPTLKYYLAPSAEISPFWIGQLNIGITTVGDDAFAFSLMGGFGAEWFVTNIFSIAGYVGLGVDVVRPGADPLRLGTFTSGLTAQLYF